MKKSLNFMSTQAAMFLLFANEFVVKQRVNRGKKTPEEFM